MWENKKILGKTNKYACRSKTNENPSFYHVKVFVIKGKVQKKKKVILVVSGSAAKIPLLDKWV